MITLRKVMGCVVALSAIFAVVSGLIGMNLVGADESGAKIYIAISVASWAIMMVSWMVYEIAKETEGPRQ